MIKPTRSPFFYFFVFLLLNASLSWLPLTLSQRFWLFPPILLLELILAFFAFPLADSRETPLFLRHSAVSVPWAAWTASIAVAIFMRFFHLISLPAWPTWDDANYSFFGINLAEKWQWPLFIGHEKTMPLFTWLQGFFYKIFEPSLFSLWFYPAILSLLAFFLSYVSARQFFPKTFSFLFTSFWGFSFWPVYYGKFCAYLGIFQWVMEFLLLLMLGLYLKASSENRSNYAFFLGLCIGCGFYSSLFFLIPAIVCCVTVFMISRQGNRFDLKTMFFFLLPMVVLFLPLAPGFLENIVAGHVFTYSVFNQQNILSSHPLVTALSYFTSFFFGPIERSYWAFAPLWGGFFNPLLSSLFFVGLMDFSRFRRSPIFLWTVSLFILCLLPAFYFNTLECFRVDLVAPIFLFIIVIGFLVLLSTLKGTTRKLFFILMIALSFSMDLYHLFGVFHQWSITMVPGIPIKSSERYRAFHILLDQSRKNGPGLIFSDFVSDIFDQSLLTATYPFNAVRNPRLDRSKARWAAVLADLHYRDAIRGRFPQSRFFPLTDPSSPEGPFLFLALIAISSEEEQAVFLRWSAIHKNLQNLYGEMPYVVKNPDFKPVLSKLLSLYPECEKDDLLKGWLLEKILDLFLVSKDITQAQWFLDRPVSALRSFKFLDLKFAQLYHRLGMALLKVGEKARAKECFRRAGQYDPKYKPEKFLFLTE
jgi:hypothetical protein